jgi:hypothetical protein
VISVIRSFPPTSPASFCTEILDTTRTIKEGPNTAQQPALSEVERVPERVSDRTWSLPNLRGEKLTKVYTAPYIRTRKSFTINAQLYIQTSNRNVI